MNEKLAMKNGDDLENEEIEPEDEQPEVRPQVAGDGQGRTRRTSTLTRRTSTLTRRKERKGIELQPWPDQKRIEATEAFLVDLYYDQFEASIMKLMNDNMADRRLRYRARRRHAGDHDPVPGKEQH